MPHVRYNGRHGGVLLWLDEKGNAASPGDGGDGVEVERGHQVEVSRAFADELLSRGDEWTEVKDPGGAKAKAQKEE